MDATTWIKVIGFTLLTFAMWTIGYICGKVEGHDEDVDTCRKLDLSSNPDSVRRALDVDTRRKGS